MVEKETLSELRLRKQALILESELNRLALRGQCHDLRTMTAGFGLKNRACLGWFALVPVAGILAARLFRRPGSALGRALFLLKWLQPLCALWKGFARGRSRSR